MENLGESRLIARSGAMLFLGAGLVALANSFALRALGVDGVDVGHMRLLGLISLVSAVVTFYIP